MDKFRDMKTFMVVADAGSYTVAARVLETTTGRISRLISELETHLNARLFNRTTRRIALTEAGERYLSRCVAIFESVREAEAEASEAQEKPAGVLRVHAMSSIGQNYVVPAIAAYQARFPDVTIDLTLSQNVPDPVEEGYEVVLRVSPDALPDSSYVSHKLGTVQSVLCASPRYLQSHGAPAEVEDLKNHMCLQVSLPIFSSDRWVLVGPDGERTVRLPDSRFKVNVPDAMVIALQEGMGIGALPSLAVRSSFRNGTLIRVLPDWHLQHLNIYALYPSRRFLDAKIKTWIGFFRSWIADALDTDEKILGNAESPLNAVSRAAREH